MYIIPHAVSQDSERRWAMPDRVSFASGAGQVLAHAFLTRYRDAGFHAVRMQPRQRFTGNHIVVVRHDDLAFGYHGYSR